MFRRSKFANPEFVWIDLKCLTILMFAFRCCHCYNDKPDMGCESTNVHHKTWGAYRVSQPFTYVLFKLRAIYEDRVCVLTSWTDGIREICKSEGLKGLYRGTSLALFGVSNGAIQFMCYEELKRWGFERKRRQFAKAGREWTTNDDKLVSTYNRIHNNYVLTVISPFVLV